METTPKKSSYAALKLELFNCKNDKELLGKQNANLLKQVLDLKSQRKFDLDTFIGVRDENTRLRELNSTLSDNRTHFQCERAELATALLEIVNCKELEIAQEVARIALKQVNTVVKLNDKNPFKIMEETLVQFETAKLAQQKGFPQGEMRSYLLVPYSECVQDKTLHKNLGYGDLIGWYSPNNRSVNAPTQSLLQKWLREVHKIDCTPFYTLTEEGKLGYTDCVYSDLVPDKDIENEEVCLPYEEALEIALQYALTLLPDWKP